jgi:hypothetical protein
MSIPQIKLKQRNTSLVLLLLIFGSSLGVIAQGTIPTPPETPPTPPVQSSTTSVESLILNLQQLSDKITTLQNSLAVGFSSFDSKVERQRQSDQLFLTLYTFLYSAYNHITMRKRRKKELSFQEEHLTHMAGIETRLEETKKELASFSASMNEFRIANEADLKATRAELKVTQELLRGISSSVDDVDTKVNKMKTSVTPSPLKKAVEEVEVEEEKPKGRSFFNRLMFWKKEKVEEEDELSSLEKAVNTKGGLKNAK